MRGESIEAVPVKPVRSNQGGKGEVCRVVTSHERESGGWSVVLNVPNHRENTNQKDRGSCLTPSGMAAATRGGRMWTKGVGFVGEALKVAVTTTGDRGVPQQVKNRATM